MGDEDGAFRHSSGSISLNGRNEGLSYINFHVKDDLIADTLDGAVFHQQKIMPMSYHRRCPFSCPAGRSRQKKTSSLTQHAFIETVHSARRATHVL